jgi:hypothetical protein
LEVKTPITVEVQRKIMVRAAELAITYVNDFFDTTEERRLLLVEASPRQELGGKSNFCSLSFGGTNPERERVSEHQILLETRGCALCSEPSQFDADVFGKLSCLCRVCPVVWNRCNATVHVLPQRQGPG